MGTGLDRCLPLVANKRTAGVNVRGLTCACDCGAGICVRRTHSRALPVTLLLVMSHTGVTLQPLTFTHRTTQHIWSEIKTKSSTLPKCIWVLFVVVLVTQYCVYNIAGPAENTIEAIRDMLMNLKVIMGVVLVLILFKWSL